MKNLLFGSEAVKLFNRISGNPQTAGLIDRYNRTAMTYAGLVNDSGQKPIEHAKRFVNEMLGLGIKYDDFLSKVNYMALNSTGTTLDDWELNEVGDIRKHTENTAADHEVTETHTARTITPQLIDLYAPLSYERVGRWIRSAVGEGAKTGAGVDLIIGALRQKFRNELQNLWINGNDDSTSTHLAIEDGWIKRGMAAADADNLKGASWDATPTIATYCDALSLEAAGIRNGELLNHPQITWVMSRKNQKVLKNGLRNTTSDKGMDLYYVDAKSGVNMYDGIPIETPTYWPNNVVCLTLMKNFAWGLCDEINRDIPLIEYTRQALKGQHEFVGRISGGCNIAKASIILFSYDSSDTDLAAWAAE